MYFVAEPFKNPRFTNPYMITRYLHRGLAIWEQQATYVKEVMPNGKVKFHCPSYAFTEILRLMVDAGVNHGLKFHRHRCDHKKPWSKLGLCRANNDPLEGSFSEERGSSGLCTTNNGSMYTIADSCRNNTRVQQIYDHRPTVRRSRRRQNRHPP